MKILIIPDKFKGSLSANKVAEIIGEGIKHAFPHASLHTVLASDGGDGFLEAVARHTAFTEVSIKTLDPLGRSIIAPYLIQAGSKSAYIELASACGLVLLSQHERNPLMTSTLGTGLQIMDALQKGAQKIYLGLGGSATNDGGIGVAHALGYSFLDQYGNPLFPNGAALSQIHTIVPSTRKYATEFSFVAVNDVDNPLFGPDGAAHTYGAQKGASLDVIQQLDRGLKHLHEHVLSQMGKDLANTPGAGAAGGTAYGLNAFFNAHFCSGISFILEMAKVEELLQSTSFDYIITGEGKIDKQTLNGKLIKGVVDLGLKYKIPVLGVCGSKAINAEDEKALGLESCVETRIASESISYNMKHAETLLKKTVYQLFKRLKTKS